MRRLPPLTTLPVFEAASRLGSYSLAADELHVTHGAVSHQIRSLEAFLGAKLFARAGRGVVLTAEGREFAARVRESLAAIADAADAARPAHRDNALTISVLPSFASRWLMPRVGRFLESHPHYQVSVEAVQTLSNFRADGVDVALRFGIGPWPGLHCERLAGDSYFAAVSPRFRKGRLPRTVAALKSLPLFHGEPDMWKKWFDIAGDPFEPDLPPIIYNDAALFLQQAVAGEGIVMTRRSLAETDLQAGRLVRLFDIEFPAEKSYHFVCLPEKARLKKVADFREWIKGEIDWGTR